jgi:hypothetical protein
LKTTFSGATTTVMSTSGSGSGSTSGPGSGSPNKLSQFNEIPDHGVTPEGEGEICGVIDNVNELELDVGLLADVEVVQAEEEPVGVPVVDDLGVREGRSGEIILMKEI